MTVLTSGLIIFDHGAQGWNASYSANFQLIHDTFVEIFLAGVIPGTDTIAAVPSISSAVLTDSSTGTPGSIIADGTAAYSQVITNDNNASLTDQINKLIDDVTDLQASHNDLLVKLRKSTGVGILAG